MSNLWEHDLWAEIYDVKDPLTRNVLIQMYRLVLDMRESDILAQKIAAAVNRERSLTLTFVQKMIGVLFGLVVALDAGVHVYQVLGG